MRADVRLPSGEGVALDRRSSAGRTFKQEWSAIARVIGVDPGADGGSCNVIVCRCAICRYYACTDGE